jgi:uncharacterized protein (TIGR02246 family)
MRLAACLLLLASIACTKEPDRPSRSPPPSSEADVVAIQQMYKGFVAANLAGDVEKELSFLTDDAVFMPPGVPDIVGKSAMRARWTPREETDSLEVFDLDPGEIMVVGDLAYSRGTSTARSRSRRTGRATLEVVRHLDILRRQPDGRWLIARHIRNASNSPAP